MTALFEKLFELLAAWINYLIPWAILSDDQCGLVRRLGKFNRLLRHGLNWKWPIIEEVLHTSAALESEVLREQSLTTRDGASVTLRTAISYRVIDPKKYILDCGTVLGIINDVGCTVVAELVPQFSAQVVLGHDGDDADAFAAKLERKVKHRAKRWGIEVDTFGIVERVRAPAFRLITSASAGVHQ